MDDTSYETQLSAMGDLMDNQLETSDGYHIGRVADLKVEWRMDGSLVLTQIVTGPQALAGRVWEPLRVLSRIIFHDRFEHSIPLSEVREVGPTIHLKGEAEHYKPGQSDRWIAQHVLRWIPGSGRV